MTPDAIRAALAPGGGVVVMVMRARGSTPREAGAAMVVLRSGASVGTVGGGTVEHRAITLATAMLAERRDREVVDFPLGPDLDQCCGGHMTLALARFDAGAPGPATREVFTLWPGGPEIVPETRRQVVVYGAGHVGRAVIAALGPLPFRLRWVDGRADAFPEDTPVETVETPLPEAEAKAAEPGAFHLVMTQSHALDLEIVAAVLGAGRAGYCGLIGSATKRQVFARRLAERGVSAEALCCPIGAPGIDDKRPAVIAASVAADLLLRDAALAAHAPVRRTG